MTRMWPGVSVDPLWGLRAMQRELSRLFNRPESGGFPPINVYDAGDAFVVEAELPGVGTSELELSITGDTLELKGKRAGLPGVGDEQFQRRERGEGAFARTVVLPETVDADGIKATTRDGVLTIRLPKSEASKPRRISVDPS